LVYYAFDLIHLEGEDLRRMPRSERRFRLQRLVAGSDVMFSENLPGRLPTMISVLKKNRLEGIVAKRKDSIYEAGKRSGAWRKLALKPRQEFVIGGYRMEGGSLDLLLVGFFDAGELLFAGKVRQGLNRTNRAALLKRLGRLKRKRCAFINLPNSRRGHWGEGVTAEQMEDYVWVKPEVVAQIKFAEWTMGEVLRHAEFDGLREDKTPGEVVREG
jgi:bifunctional non-homologous end joining protein LigD